MITSGGAASVKEGILTRVEFVDQLKLTRVVRSQFLASIHVVLNAVRWVGVGVAVPVTLHGLALF